uniref:Dihydroorotate oxidase B, electron transfer subunit n=1 Tax=Candidatus Kentrum sp. UNK TaxID=2126344 RepID=A0A451AZW3_9GAMM|nr:MAG: dihydroorotate oxidase B, electron transfer subunit [Candidatus Kentron sp. UNK]VFK71569.1 MAG: dihydroorotate oxidase B, electron transfer subunit [Candidatus Kentron sp. UNK]
MERPHHATLFVEEAGILSREAFEGDRIMLEIQAPRIAAAALPGTFLHVRCGPEFLLRRPLSLMDADPDSGRIAIFFKVVGKGTRLLAAKSVGEVINVIGPIGVSFRPEEDRPRALLLGGGLGMPPMMFLAARLRTQPPFEPLLLMGSEIPFPFEARPSRILIPGMPDGAIGAMPSMEDWGIPSRLASRQGYPGCFHGFVTDLARAWLTAQSSTARRETALYACGPEAMLRSVADLAYEYDLPCQVCLEEFMACGVGACAGCVVPVTTGKGPAMKRICVDGPVFDAREVFGRDPLARLRLGPMKP